jgi:hypothetical protein
VIDATGRSLGVVSDFQETGGTPLLEVGSRPRTAHPLRQIHLHQIDLENKRIVVNLPDGALDLNVGPQPQPPTPMVFRILTIFPDFFQGPLQYGVVAKAAESGLIQIHIHDLRTWTHDRHRTVDDRPFGGGEGMLLKPAPIFEAVESIWPERQTRERLVLLSAQGRRFIRKRPPLESIR